MFTEQEQREALVGAFLDKIIRPGDAHMVHPLGQAMPVYGGSQALH